MADQTHTAQITTMAASIHHCTGDGSIPTIIDWASNRLLYAYDAEAVTACQTYYFWQKLTLL